MIPELIWKMNEIEILGKWKSMWLVRVHGFLFCLYSKAFQFILQAEARVLDFNECSTPVRKKEDKKLEIALGGSASSPVTSSYLRMNVR